MDRHVKHKPEHEVTEQAASWFLRIQEGLSQSDFRDWRRWINEHKAHAQAFDSVTAFWRDTEELPDLPWPDDQELMVDDYDGDMPLPLSLGEEAITAEPAVAGRRVFLAAAAAVVAALIGGVVYHQASEFEATVYETAIAEHRVVELDDGSVITLGAESLISVAYERGSRNIELRSGEAYFKVAKDESRPFIVAAGRRTVRAIGTEFNVNIGVRDIKVSVIEGKVRVAGPVSVSSDVVVGPVSKSVSNLETGDVLDFNRVGGIAIVRDVDPVLTTSWMKGRLAYVGATLDTVITDVNRYSPTEIIIGDDVTGDLLFTGTIFSDDIDNWLQGVEKAFPLRLVRVEGYGVLLIRDNTDH